MPAKREGELKSAFTRELKRQLPLFLVLQHSTNGAPDRAITGNGKTSYWEYKHATPEFESQGDQELLCMRLAVQGYCRYVIWWESTQGTGQRTMIVTPRNVHERNITPEIWCIGFDHRWLVEQVKKVHGV